MQQFFYLTGSGIFRSVSISIVWINNLYLKNIRKHTKHIFGLFTSGPIDLSMDPFHLVCYSGINSRNLDMITDYDT